MSLRIRRGTEAQRLGFTPDMGEIIWTTNGEKLYVGDGVTPGGKDIAAQLAGTGLLYNGTTGKLDSVASFTTDQIAEGINNKYFSQELAQDAIGAAILAGTQSGIIVTYTDNGAGAGSINFTVTPDGVGMLQVADDLTPALGGDLDLNSHNISGTGDIDIVGTVYASLGLGGDLALGGNDITGSGNINITGTIDSIGTLTATSSTVSTGLINAVGVTTGPSATSLIKVRTSRTNNTAVQNGDNIGSLTFEAYTGSVDKKAALLQSNITSVISGNNFDTDFTVFVLTASGNYTPFVFRSTGVFDTAALKLAPIDTATINLITPATAAIVYNTDAASLQVYTGSAYKTLSTFVSVPGSSTAAGKPGQFSADADYVYVCHADGLWIRIAKDATW